MKNRIRITIRIFLIAILGIAVMAGLCSEDDNPTEPTPDNGIPDGLMVVYLKGTTGDNYPGNLCMLDANSGTEIIIEGSGQCGNADVTQDGNKITYAKTVSDQWKIFIGDLTLTGIESAVEIPVQPSYRNEDPKFSPDGNKIVFKNTIAENQARIVVYDLISLNYDYLTDGSSEDWYPVFSNDGSNIIFTRGLDENSEMYLINTDGSAERRLTNNDVPDQYPCFLSNGDLVFSRTFLIGNDELGKINASNLTLDNPGEHWETLAFVNSLCSDADPYSIYINSDIWLTFVSNRSLFRYELFLGNLTESSAPLLLKSSDGYDILGPIPFLFGEPPRHNVIAVITSPAVGDTFETGETIDFTGYAYYEGRARTASIDLIWTCDGDSIGEGESFTKSDLLEGTHEIVLTATDSIDMTGADTITIYVEQDTTPPDTTDFPWFPLAIGNWWKYVDTINMNDTIGSWEILDTVYLMTLIKYSLTIEYREVHATDNIWVQDDCLMHSGLFIGNIPPLIPNPDGYPSPWSSPVVPEYEYEIVERGITVDLETGLTFSDCICIRRTFLIIPDTALYDYWFKKGVGIVKKDIVYGGEITLSEQLAAYNIE